ncbi:MAG: pilus assembly protein TadG-related protein [Acidobacteriota bacterium]|nr:pilus assembly protein TadG-related protein [Acidobacteriota bacterium]
MSHAFSPQSHEHHNERGSIMVMTALMMVGLMMAIGLCVDVARIYMARAEMQKAADAAALSAARELNTGTSGIVDAVARANDIVNTQGFGNADVGVAAVEFAVDAGGPFLDAAAAQADAENIRYVQVTTEPVTTIVLFAARALDTSHVESRKAVAGMSVGMNGVCDFFPIAVALDNPETPGTTMTLVFKNDTGTGEVQLNNNDFVVLNVSDINGDNAGNTVRLAAGGTSACMNIGNGVAIMPSTNPNNSPELLTEGVNVRLTTSPGGIGNPTTSEFPPDLDIRLGITFNDYKNGPEAKGDDRRILIVPIVTPGTYNISDPPGIIRWGAFFLKNSSTVSNPCTASPTACGSLEVEWIEERLVIGSGSYIPGGGAASSLSIPVLY